MTPKVLLHGVPETSSVWNSIAAILTTTACTPDELHQLSLPGFAAPRADGFGCTMDDYADWLVATLAEFGEPVDLVGHDWGGILAARVASWNPGSLRSWVSDAIGALQPGYRWHDLALVWQTDGAGEDFWASMMADRAASADLLASFGLPHADATAVMSALDDTMIDSILRLYRSADGIGERWSITDAIATPGLIICGDNDPFGDVAGSAALANAVGAQFVTIEGGSHFWPAQSSEQGAAAIASFWSSLDG